MNPDTIAGIIFIAAGLIVPAITLLALTHQERHQ